MSNKADATTMKRATHRELKPKLRFPEFRDAGEWEVKLLGTVCKITNGKSNAQDHDETGIYPLFDRSEVIKKSNNYFFDCEAVIVPGEGMRFLPKYYKGKFDLHQRAYVLKDFRCDSKFIYYTMDLLRDVLAAKAVRSTVLSLRLPILENFVIHVPNDTEEQQKIADCLSSIDELIIAQTQKLDTLKAHKKGLMQQLFPAEGETLPKLRFPEFRDAGEWEAMELREISSLITKGTTPTSLGFQFSESGIHFVKIESIDSDGNINLLKVAYITKDCDEAIKRSRLKKNDILFSIAGALGVVAIVKEEVLPANTNQALAIIRIKHGCSHAYLTHFLNAPVIQMEIGKIKSGAAQLNISLAQVGNLLVLLPSPKEQQKIADCLSSIDELIIAQTQKLDTLKAHKKGLMQQLFPSAESQQDLSRG